MQLLFYCHCFWWVEISTYTKKIFCGNMLTYSNGVGGTMKAYFNKKGLENVEISTHHT
jgi:hypothetical protein